MLGREERHEILEDEWQIPQAEIAQAIRLNIKAKNQRLRTLNNIGKVSEMEEKLESVKSKFKKRAVPWKKRSSKQTEDLVKQASVAAKQQQAIEGDFIKQIHQHVNDSSSRNKKESRVYGYLLCHGIVHSERIVLFGYSSQHFFFVNRDNDTSRQFVT